MQYCKSTTTLHYRAAFRAIGIDTQISISNNGVQLFATFNLLLIKKDRDYQISHITQLINSNLPLTPNQTYIYNCHKKNENPTKSSSNMPIPDFSNKVKRNLLPVPYIFYASSKF